MATPPARRPFGGCVSRFVTRHQRAWDMCFAALAVVFVVASLIDDEHPTVASVDAVLVLAILFLAEFSLRLVDAPSRIAYLRTHWLDLVSCVPFVGGSFRILRLARLARFGRVLHVFDRSRRQSAAFLLPFLLVLWFAAAAAIWSLEHGINPAMSTPGDALYWAFITATTVGYGDVHPVTAAGQMLAGGLAFIGIGLIGFVSARLTATWLRDDQVDPSVIARELESLRRELQGMRSLLSQVTAFAHPSEVDVDGEERLHMPG